MRTVSRFVTLGPLLAAVVLGTWWLRSAGATKVVSIGPHIEVTGATREQLALARWAIGRFEIAGLEPPSVEIAFHGEASECEGHMGYARSGHVDVCTVLVNEMTRRNLLHEISHAWLDQNVGVVARTMFLQERVLSSWNSSRDPWELRGFEQGAEIMAWALGDRILSAQIPDNDPEQMARAYELLAGQPLPG